MITTALSTISELPKGKVEIAIFSRQLKSEILSGEKNPLKILTQLKYAEKVIADILKDEDVEQCFLKEAELYGTKTFDFEGTKLTIGEVGTKYDFASCGDLKWSDLTAELESLKSKIKLREDFLKSLPDEGTVCPDTGLYINKATKSSKTKVTVKI